MKRFTVALAILVSLTYVSCKKSTSSTPAVNNNNSGIAANTFVMDDSITATTTTASSSTSTFLSATYAVTLTGSTSGGRVGLFFKQKPAASGTYKIKHVYPADNLAANECFVDVNYSGCNYVSADTTQSVTVTVSGSNVNVQFKNLTYTFNNWVVSGYPAYRVDGKMSGNLNFQ
jgi:hypothetical protein